MKAARGFAKRLLFVIATIPMIFYTFLRWVITGKDPAAFIVKFVKWVDE